MNKTIRLEELAMFALSIYALYLHNAEWWVYPILLLGPDISMLGYLAGNKPGAICYNFFHHKGIAIAFYISGLVFGSHIAEIAGIILFGHSSMDRLFGYGLKYFDGFKNTHLGLIGKK
ncbi:MAG: DUF4260 domain-containing protein [Chitinophagaceae bacterium]|nr:DUF4260 domain-containing protein [Chitinophagaceae bacterium]